MPEPPARAPVLQDQFFDWLLSSGFTFHNAVGGLQPTDVLVCFVIGTANWLSHLGARTELST